MRQRILNSERKRQSILKHALQTFVRLGFDATRMEDVACDADVSKQTIYSHFGSKEGLFKAVLEDMCRQCNYVYDHYFVELGTSHPREFLTKTMLAVLPEILSQEHVSIHRLIYAENARHPEISLIHQRLKDESYQKLARYLEQLHAQKILCIDNARRAAEDFIVLCQGTWFYRCLSNERLKPSREEMDAQVRHGISLFFKAYAC